MNPKGGFLWKLRPGNEQFDQVDNNCTITKQFIKKTDEKIAHNIDNYEYKIVECNPFSKYKTIYIGNKKNKITYSKDSLYEFISSSAKSNILNKKLMNSNKDKDELIKNSEKNKIKDYSSTSNDNKKYS
ncbi:unnamed protein product, partial [marine sediment metagenome]